MSYKMQQLNQINISTWVHLLLLAITKQLKNHLTKEKWSLVVESKHLGGNILQALAILIIESAL